MNTATEPIAHRPSMGAGPSLRPYGLRYGPAPIDDKAYPVKRHTKGAFSLPPYSGSFRLILRLEKTGRYFNLVSDRKMLQRSIANFLFDEPVP